MYPYRPPLRISHFTQFHFCNFFFYILSPLVTFFYPFYSSQKPMFRFFIATLFLIASVAVGISPLDNPITWLSTSSMSCPAGITPRGSLATCTARVDYPNASYVLPLSSVQARHDGCTHGAPTSCTLTAVVTNSSCVTDANNTVTCEYPIQFAPPTDVVAGGVFTVSLTRSATVDSSERRIPETLIVQGTIACGAFGQHLVLGAIVMLATLVWALV